MRKNLEKSVLFFLFVLLFQKTTNAQIITLLSEDFSSSSFATNGWTFPNGQGNWQIGSSNTPSGATAPNAYFNWAVSTSNYSTSLVSTTINATAITGPVTLDYLLLFNPYSTATLEQFKVEYKAISSSTWTLLTNYTNSVTSITNWSVTNIGLPGVSGQNFQIRFTAYGISSFNITRWSLDNIVVKGTSCLASLPSLTIVSTPTICSGKSATLTAFGGGVSYTWSPAGGNSSVAIVSPTANTTYALISSMPGCTTIPVSAITTLTVFTNTTSLTASASPSSICAGSNVTLSAGGASSYSWSNGATTSSINVSPTTSLTYSVSNTNSIGCVATKTIAVNVNPIPIISAFSTSSLICSGGINNLIASGANTYSWSNGATSAIISVTPQATTLYTVIGTDLQGCVGSGTINVAVNPKVTIASTATSICAGATITLNASSSVSYTWNNASSSQSITVSPTANTIYSVSAIDNIGCNTSASLSVLVNPIPTVTAISSTNIVCYGSSATLTASGASTYTWNSSLTGASYTAFPVTNTVYTVSGTSAAGCSGPSSSAVIGVTVVPVPTITAVSSASVICSGSTLTLSASGANTYSWNFGAAGSSATVNPLVTGTYSVLGTNTQFCSSTGTVFINVLSSPTITIAGSATNICVGSTATLLANGAQSYSWNTGSTLNVIYVTPVTTSIYTLSGTGSNNCVSSQSIQINVNPYPVLSVSSNDSLICEGELVNLTASGALSYSWSNTMTGSIIAVSPSLTTTFTVEGSNNGCKTSTTLTQYVDECTGLSKYEKSHDNLYIYPNPGNGIVTIQLHWLTENTTVFVYTPTGTLILEERLLEEKQTLDFSKQSPGVYYLKVISNQRQSVVKLIKN